MPGASARLARRSPATSTRTNQALREPAALDKLNHIEHANLSRRLIENVGGLRKAADLCRVSESVLSGYQNPNMPAANMPADVISALQVAGGTTLYSDAQRAEVDQPLTVIADPLRHSCDMVMEAAEALSHVQAALADGVVSASDFTACDRALADLEAQIEIVRASMRRAHVTGDTTVHPLRRAS